MSSRDRAAAGIVDPLVSEFERTRDAYLLTCFERQSSKFDRAESGQSPVKPGDDELAFTRAVTREYPVFLNGLKHAASLYGQTETEGQLIASLRIVMEAYRVFLEGIVPSLLGALKVSNKRQSVREQFDDSTQLASKYVKKMHAVMRDLKFNLSVGDLRFLSRIKNLHGFTKMDSLNDEGPWYGVFYAFYTSFFAGAVDGATVVFLENKFDNDREKIQGYLWAYNTIEVLSDQVAAINNSKRTPPVLLFFARIIECIRRWLTEAHDNVMLFRRTHLGRAKADCLADFLKGDVPVDREGKDAAIRAFHRRLMDDQMVGGRRNPYTRHRTNLLFGGRNPRCRGQIRRCFAGVSRTAMVGVR